ncbi:MAG: hypothetical protein ACHQX1_00930 [Candidatus Micrarchaeales archaeon]
MATPRFDEIDEGSSNVISDEETLGMLRANARRPIRYDDADGLGINNHEAIERLVNSGSMESFVSKIDGKEEKWLMLPNKSISIEHEVSVRIISELLTLRGIDNLVIDNSNGPDISTRINGKRVAIEYETGSKSFQSTTNMIGLRLKDYEGIIMFTNRHSFDYYKRSFASGMVHIASLDGPGSIDQAIGALQDL